MLESGRRRLLGNKNKGLLRKVLVDVVVNSKRSIRLFLMSKYVGILLF